LKRSLHAFLGFFTLFAIAPGCESNPGPEMAAPGKLDNAGPNQRFKFKEEYKQALDKDGHLILKPGMKKPDFPAKPKS
jgi:hypothetical protein